MATQFQLTPDAPFPAAKLSFNDLADKLRSLTEVPSLAELDELVERTDISDDEVLPYLGFKEGKVFFADFVGVHCGLGGKSVARHRKKRATNTTTEFTFRGGFPFRRFPFLFLEGPVWQGTLP